MAKFYDNLKNTGKSVVIIDNELMDANFINDESILNNIVNQIMTF